MGSGRSKAGGRYSPSGLDRVFGQTEDNDSAGYRIDRRFISRGHKTHPSYAELKWALDVIASWWFNVRNGTKLPPPSEKFAAKARPSGPGFTVKRRQRGKR